MERLNFDAEHGRCVVLDGTEYPVNKIPTRDMLPGGFMDSVSNRMSEAKNDQAISLAVDTIQRYIPTLEKDVILDLPGDKTMGIFLFIIGVMKGEETEKNE